LVKKASASPSVASCVGLRALGVLNFATATNQGMKQRAYQDLNRLVRMIVRDASWKQLDDNVITKIVHRIFRLLAERLRKRKLAAALPVAGIAVGAGLNALTLSRAALGPADAATRQAAARAALAHGVDVVALAGAAIIVAGTAGSLVLARGRRTERVAIPVPQAAGAS
jgi:hypothetical protein